MIEPRSRIDREFLVADEQDEEIRIGRSHVTARRVIFLSSDGDRIVWFDMQGRVLRLEILDILPSVKTWLADIG